MKLSFPKDFFWGTSTAAAQIETASNHSWKGVKALDGYTFERTTDHEKQRLSDADIIAELGSVYRCGVDWARLQPSPLADFDPSVTAEYITFFERLTQKNVKIMFVLHHFAHPIWLEEKGGFQRAENLIYFLNYVEQVVFHFNKYVSFWNTFNEPNVFVLNGYITGNFPPFIKNYFTANKVLKNLQKAHESAYQMLKNNDATKPIGISFNTCWFEGLDPLGWLAANFIDWWFHRRAAKHFEMVDFFGMSYYAYIPFHPLPIIGAENPQRLTRLGIPKDKMWGYRPEGLLNNMLYFWEKYKKPIIITENGVCTEPENGRDAVRINALKDYLKLLHEAIFAHKIPVLGYIYWSPWDNFEWNLGATFCFGLLKTNFQTGERTNTPSADFYRKIVKDNAIEI